MPAPFTGLQDFAIGDLNYVTKLNANNDFSKAKHYLEEVPKLTQNSSELKYVKSRMDTINQLLEATQKDFF